MVPLAKVKPFTGFVIFKKAPAVLIAILAVLLQLNVLIFSVVVWIARIPEFRETGPVPSADAEVDTRRPPEIVVPPV